MNYNLHWTIQNLKSQRRNNMLRDKKYENIRNIIKYVKINTFMNKIIKLKPYQPNPIKSSPIFFIQYQIKSNQITSQDFFQFNSIYDLTLFTPNKNISSTYNNSDIHFIAIYFFLLLYGRQVT